MVGVVGENNQQLLCNKRTLHPIHRHRTSSLVAQQHNNSIFDRHRTFDGALNNTIATAQSKATDVGSLGQPKISRYEVEINLFNNFVRGVASLMYISLCHTLNNVSFCQSRIVDKRVASLSILTAHNIEQLGGNCLLALFVILHREFGNKVVGIVCRRLHSHHSCGVFRGKSRQGSRIKP